MHKCSFLAVLLLLCTGLFAQDPPGAMDRFEGNERVQAARVAYITERLALTSEQSATFWPVFREYEAARKALRKDRIKENRVENLSEEEAKQVLAQQIDTEEKMVALKREYMPRFLEVLSARQLVKLPKADRDFRREMLRMISNRGERKRGPGRD